MKWIVTTAAALVFATAAHAQQLSATSNVPGLILEAVEIKNRFDAMTEVILRATNDTDAQLSLSVRCGLYDKDDAPLGEAGGWINAIPPHSEVIGTARAPIPGVTRVDCRVTNHYQS